MFSFLFWIQNLKEFFVTKSFFFKGNCQKFKKKHFGLELLLDINNVYFVGP
jgi:hypothetical protein